MANQINEEDKILSSMMQRLAAQIKKHNKKPVASVFDSLGLRWWLRG